MTDLMFPGKRPRTPSFGDKHPESYSESHIVAATTFDWLLEQEISQVQVNNFLQLCCFCKKNLRHDEDLFMYGHFGAFCRKECRAKQMALDLFIVTSKENAKTVKRGKICEKSRPKDSSQDEALGNLESNTSPKFFI